MKIFILFFIFAATVYADTNTNFVVTAANNYLKPPETFAELNKRFQGADIAELSYKSHKLVVYFSRGGHGAVYSQPFVYFERDGRPVRILTGMDCPGEMDAVIEGDTLVIRRWDFGKSKKVFITFDLSTLHAG